MTIAALRDNGNRSHATTPALTAGIRGFPWRAMMLCDERLVLFGEPLVFTEVIQPAFERGTNRARHPADPLGVYRNWLFVRHSLTPVLARFNPPRAHTTHIVRSPTLNTTQRRAFDQILVLFLGTKVSRHLVPHNLCNDKYVD